MGCLFKLSRSNSISLICTHKNRNTISCIVTTTCTREESRTPKIMLMMWLFRETMASFSLLALSPPRQQKFYVALHETTYDTAEL